MPAVTEIAPGRSSFVPEPCDSLSTRGRQEEHDRTDRDVDEQRPAPAGEVGQGAAEQQSERATGRSHGGEHAESASTRRRLGERRGQQGERRGCGDGATGALCGAGADQHHLTVGEPADQ